MVAALEGSSGKPNGVLVFGEGGDVEVRTESADRPRQPISIQVANVQMATVNTPETWSEHKRVIVEEADHDVSIANELRRVRVLVSYNSFSFEVSAGGRIVSAAGRLHRLQELRIERLDSLSLTNGE